MKNIFTSAFFFLAVSAFAQDTAQLYDYGARIYDTRIGHAMSVNAEATSQNTPYQVMQNTNDKPNRESYTLKLFVNDSSVYENPVKASPYILQNNTLQLYPEEKVFIEVELQNDEVLKMKTVKKNENPSKTIEINFTQITEGKRHKSMIMKAVNHFREDLQYKALIFLMEHNKWVETNILPVNAGNSSFETWSDIIVTITLSDWKFK